MTEAERCDETGPSPIRALPAPDGGAWMRRDLTSVVDAAMDGDAGAWEEIYLEIYPRLIAYARQRLDPESAKDAVAETMARAVSGIGGFTWRGSGFDGWIFTILHHVITDNYRRLGRQRRLAPLPDLDDAADVGEGLLADEERVAMRAAFAKLSADDRHVLALRVVAGLSAEAAAEVLGKRSGAVRMAQARALVRLRGHFDQVSP